MCAASILFLFVPLLVIVVTVSELIGIKFSRAIRSRAIFIGLLIALAHSVYDVCAADNIILFDRLGWWKNSMATCPTVAATGPTTRRFYGHFGEEVSLYVFFTCGKREKIYFWKNKHERFETYSIIFQSNASAMCPFQVSVRWSGSRTAAGRPSLHLSATRLDCFWWFFGRLSLVHLEGKWDFSCRYFFFFLKSSSSSQCAALC